MRRKNDRFKGFDIPAGIVNEGERGEDAARREMLEEMNLTIEPTDILGIHSMPSRDPRAVTRIACIKRIISGAAEVGDSGDSFEWVSLEDLIKNECVASDHVKSIEII